MNCHHPLHNNPQEHRSHILRGAGLNSRSFSASQYISRLSRTRSSITVHTTAATCPCYSHPTSVHTFLRFILVLHTHLHPAIKIIPFILAFPTNTRVHFSPVQRMTQAYVVFLIGSSEKCLVNDTNHKQLSCNFLHRTLSFSTTDIPSFSMHVLK